MGNEAVLNQAQRKPGKFEKRVAEVDVIRGILILFVLFDHLFNCFMSYGYQWWQLTGWESCRCLYEVWNFYYHHVVREIVRQIILFGFVFVSGISCAFSRNNWSRACLMLLIAFVLTTGSRVVDSLKMFDFNVIIDFNVIHVLAVSTLFYCFVQNQSWKGLLASLLCWFLFSWYGMDILRTNPNFETAYIPPLINPGTYYQAQADWMPLVPYIIFFFMGAIVSYFLYPTKKPLFQRHEWERPLCFLGRNTMWVYLGHQIVLQPIFIIVTEIIKANL